MNSIQRTTQVLMILVTLVITLDAGSALADNATDLIVAINEYRASQGLEPIEASAKLNKVAQAHIQDLEQRDRGAGCNLHSWSSASVDWNSCCFQNRESDHACMWDKPWEISGYDGNGYEIAIELDGPGSVDAELALENWIRSSGHHSVIINSDVWRTMHWQAMGAAISDNYAVVWFGEVRD